ncbi:MAG: response regulator [Methanomassiliicoccales archaeon]|jgi:DNA-binding response OmpR family regulator
MGYTFSVVQERSVLGGESVIKVLMVDDNMEHIQLCSEFLPKDEFELDAAYTGGQAIEKLKTKKYDIVVLDYKLPDINGIDLLRKVRPLGLRIPVLFVSAMDDADLSFVAMKEGACDYIVKTFQYYSKLRERILENLETCDVR